MQCKGVSTTLAADQFERGIVDIIGIAGSDREVVLVEKIY